MAGRSQDRLAFDSDKNMASKSPISRLVQLHTTAYWFIRPVDLVQEALEGAHDIVSCFRPWKLSSNPVCGPTKYLIYIVVRMSASEVGHDNLLDHSAGY